MIDLSAVKVARRSLSTVWDFDGASAEDYGLLMSIPDNSAAFAVEQAA